MSLSTRSGVNFNTKTDSQGQLVFEGMYKVHQNRMYEFSRAHLAAYDGKPQVWEFRRLTAPSEKWLAAARSGDTKTLKSMLQNGANPNATAPGSVNALSFAAAAGHLEAIRLLVRHNAGISRPSSWFGTRPIVEAAAFGQTAACKVLLELGADIQETHNFRMSPLHETAFHGRKETMLFLIRKGADLTAVNNAGGTPLHVAVARSSAGEGAIRPGQIACIKLLLTEGAERNVKRNDGKTHHWTLPAN